MTNLLKQAYIRTSGYSYNNMGRLFLRLFVGVMLAQFGVRQWANFDAAAATFPSTLGMDPAASLTIMIIIEILCSFCIMLGFCTRLMIIPPLVAMILAEIYLLSGSNEATYLISWEHTGYLPVMFIGIYLFMILVGPGKISVDYFLSLHFIHSDNQSETELEEV